MMHIDQHSTAGITEELPMLEACRIFGSSASGKRKRKFDFGMNRPKGMQQQQKKGKYPSLFTR